MDRGNARAHFVGPARPQKRPIKAGACDQCDKPLEKPRRGSSGRFCQTACRRAWEAEAKRLGEKALRRRRKRAAAGPAAQAGCSRVPWKTLARQLARLGLSLLPAPHGTGPAVGAI
jgi:hypothetical protein